MQTTHLNMKTTLKLLTLALAFGLSSCVVHRTVVVEQGPPPQQYTAAPAPAPVEQAPMQQPVAAPAPQPAQPVGYDAFYNQLSPYGTWTEYQNYGYVWVPNAGANFMPYSTGGHWEYTTYGWTWASDYSWGWAPFHYGRWAYDAYYGWLWIPGNQWGPAWVSWRNCDGYYGWAPMCPGNVDFYNAYYTSPNSWVFCDRAHIHDRYLDRYYAPRANYANYIHNSTVIEGTRYGDDKRYSYYSGPDRAEAERYSGSPIATTSVVAANRPGQSYSGSNGYNMYRPEVNTPVAATRPSSYSSLNTIPTAAQRPVATQPNANYKPNNEEEHRYNGGNNGGNNNQQEEHHNSFGGNNGGNNNNQQQEEHHNSFGGNNNNQQQEEHHNSFGGNNNNQQQQQQHQEPVNNPQPQRPVQNNVQAPPANNPQPQRQQAPAENSFQQHQNNNNQVQHQAQPVQPSNNSMHASNANVGQQQHNNSKPQQQKPANNNSNKKQSSYSESQKK